MIDYAKLEACVDFYIEASDALVVAEQEIFNRFGQPEFSDLVITLFRSKEGLKEYRTACILGLNTCESLFDKMVEVRKQK